MQIVQVTSADTHELRRAVLRGGDAERDVTFPEDEDEDTVHLAVRDPGGQIVAISTWIPNTLTGHGIFDGMPAVQLRGMATATALQSVGVGSLLFEAGVRHAAAVGARLVWARARDSALGFYAKHDCIVSGDGFVDEVTGLDHHIVIRSLTD